jgi:hypothetical protein
VPRGVGFGHRQRGGMAAEPLGALYGPRTSKPSQPFKLAVLELVSRRVLELVEVERSGFLRRKKIAVLSAGEGTTNNEVLLAVQNLYIGCGKTVYPGGLVGVEVKTLAEQAGKIYSSRKGFTEAVVMKAIVEKGYFHREQRTLLKIIPYQRWSLTRSGEAARARLTVSMRLGESQFGLWMDRQPNRALAYVGLMGPAILLMEPLHPDLKRLHEVQERTGDGGSGISDDASESEDPSGDLNLEGLDLDVLYDLDGTFDAIDSGVDAGGAGDGGDGDGGNGGD